MTSDMTMWRPFTDATIDTAPTYGGNYEIALQDEEVEYDDGDSETIYFGMGINVKARLRQHLHGSGNPVIAGLVRRGKRLKVRWRRHEEPRKGECALFEDFEEEFGELPMANQRGCRVQEVLDRID